MQNYAKGKAQKRRFSAVHDFFVHLQLNMTTKLYHVICEWLRELTEGTPWEGHLFAVGGCCRDEILGLEINDLDLAVDLPMGGVKFARWLEKKRLTIGRPIFFMKYGTAKLRLRKFPDDEIELVQTRKEQYTRETSRCPEVVFGSIKEDCYRRDFTVNSLYYDITRRVMVDITAQGIADIEAGIIRTPMDPDETFNDDPVRILRGLRFANRFNWRIEPGVWDALLHHIHRLEIVSRERVHSEFCKMLNGPAPIEILETLKDIGALEVMIPPIKALYHGREKNGINAWDAGLERLRVLLENAPEAPTRMRLACLFIGLTPNATDASKITRLIMQNLRFDRPIISDVSFLVRYHALRIEDLDNPRYVRAIQNLAALPRRMALLEAFLSAQNCGHVAAKLVQADKELIRSNSSGYNPEKEASARHKKQERFDNQRRRRRRHGRRRNNKHE
ncbi:MAG: CCA tRNA nucleotidyltransferase [Bacteroidales bacterium]|nr:CCA tRNA nucleotidyltransferase [Bacteroidales bacterium]